MYMTQQQYVCMCMYIYIYMYKYMHGCMAACMYIYMYMHKLRILLSCHEVAFPSCRMPEISFRQA